MNYSSLAILSRCPQAPVPNLGQYDHHSISSSSTSSVPAEGENDPSHLVASSDPRHGAVSSTAAASAAIVQSDFAAQRSNVPATTSFSGQHLPASGVSPAAVPGSSASVSTIDDDDFDDFKTAPTLTAPPSNHALAAVPSCDTVSG